MIQLPGMGNGERANALAQGKIVEQDANLGALGTMGATSGVPWNDRIAYPNGPEEEIHSRRAILLEEPIEFETPGEEIPNEEFERRLRAQRLRGRRVYLAGPMTGYEEYNFPAFHEAAADLRTWGAVVWSPAEKDEADGFDPANDVALPLREYMKDDLPAVLESSFVVVLPGWEKSKGANIEVAVAHGVGTPVLTYPEFEVIEPPAPKEEPGMKATNPKDAIGSSKIPMHLWPPSATVYGVLGLLDGALKYGRSNWREAGVRFTIYYDAMRRHLDALLEGEWDDPDSGIPHLGHILACAAIIVDARETGQLLDDRNYRGSYYRETVDALTADVDRLKEKHADKSPKHFTIWS